MKEKYGFVYIWYDRKHRRYYIGCHWGTEDDGYICSSPWMRKSYKRRPSDFKRRTLKRIHSNRQELLDEEYKFLSMIKDEELGKRYYNLKNHKSVFWHADDKKRMSVNQKISRALLESYKKNPKTNKSKQKTSIAMKKYYKENPRTPEHCKKISENSKRLQKEKKIGMHGRKHKPETIEKMSQNNAMKNPEYVERVRLSKQGIKYLNKNGKRKMAVPNTEKWNVLVEQGYKEGY